jgi:hypothetical protein
VGKFTARVKRMYHAWGTFNPNDNPQTGTATADLGVSYSRSPTRVRYRFGYQKTIIQAIYTRISIDFAAVPIYHARIDENRQFQEELKTGLDNCLTVEANIDQGASAFRQDLAMTLFDEGVAAILPIETTLNPLATGGYDVLSMRVGRIIQWFPQHVKVRAYNEKKGLQEDVIVPKSMVAIVENPLYSVMNEPSSTLQRLLRKLSLLDEIDEQSASGKLDLIIQLPYALKTEARRQEAEKRRKEIEFQLTGTQHGIAYTDGTEKVIQLNRPVENNLLDQIDRLTKILYGELGITDTVMNGTADEPTMINYFNRTIEPLLRATVEAMIRSFLTKTARTQGQSVVFIKNPFALIPAKDLAEIADKFTRNEILTGNELRSFIGVRPSKDPKADKLNNSNIPESKQFVPNTSGQPMSTNGQAPDPPPDPGLDQINTVLKSMLTASPSSKTPQGVSSQNGSKPEA